MATTEDILDDFYLGNNSFNQTTNQDQSVIPQEGIEFFECQKCGEYNIIKNKPRNRRTKRPRHLRVDDVTWASIKKYAVLNNVSMDYALMLLLHHARTSNVTYLVNERQLVEPKKYKKKPKPKD